MACNERDKLTDYSFVVPFPRQRNGGILADKGELRVLLPKRLIAELDRQCPDFLDRAGFLGLLLNEALTARANVAAYSVGAGRTVTSQLDYSSSLNSTSPERETQELESEATAVSSKIDHSFEDLNQRGESEGGQTKKITRAKPSDPFARKTLPDDAIPNDLLDVQQLLEEFWSVKKGVRSERAWNRLCNKLRGFTPEDRRKSLEAACTAGWADVYEPKPERSALYAKPEPASKHPAYRDFTAERLEREAAASEGGVLDGLI